MASVIDSTPRRSRKKLPDIPPEELALHGKTGSSEAGGKQHDLPPEVQAQFIRHVHKRSRSLSGLDTYEFERKQQVEPEKENVEPKAHHQNEAAPQIEELNEKEDGNEVFARSLPSTPGMLAYMYILRGGESSKTDGSLLFCGDGQFRL